MLDDKKFELKDEDLDDVSGGAFVYKDTDGNGTADTCEIEGAGTYHCNGNSKYNIIRLCVDPKNKNATLEDIVQQALALGYIW